MADFSIVTDYKNNDIWTLSDKNGSIIQATAVGKLAKIGSVMGAGLAEQTEVLREMVEKIRNLRDNSSKFTPANFPAMQIVSGKILPPSTLDISQLVESGINIYSSTTNISDIDKLVQLESWLDQTFGNTISPVVKLTYRLPGSSSDSWVILRDVIPIPALPQGSLPQNPTGGTALNKPFSYEGQPEIFMMVQDSDGSVVKAKVSGIDEVFAMVSSLKEYQDYIEQRSLNRSQSAVTTLNNDEIKDIQYDAIAWKKGGDQNFNYAKLPLVSIQSSALGSTTAPQGTILRTENNEYFYVVSPKNGDKDAETQKVEIGNSYLISPDEVNLASIRSDYGDQVTFATQISAKQGLFINELMQKHTMHFDAASNVLKAFVDMMNRISNQV